MSDEQANARAPQAAESLPVEARKATVFVERKVSVKQYESLTVGLHYPVNLPAVAGDLVADEEAIKEAFFIAKAHIFEQAGVPFEDKDGILAEVVIAAFPNSQEVAAPRPAAARGSAPVEGAPDVCPDCGGTEFYDNRVGKRNPKAPDFKCKDRSCNKGFWPPR